MAATLRFLIMCVAAVLCGGVAQVAYADTAGTVYAGGSPLVLTIPVTASVGGSCGFADAGAPTGTFAKDDFDRLGFSNDFAFRLNCTGPARVAVISANGGLAASADAPSGYVNRAAYSVELKLVASDGTTAQASCDASALTSGGACSFAGTASLTQGLRLGAASTNVTGSYLRVSAPAYIGSGTMVAGTYTDTLTVTVSPAL
ncbi:hypothetical protein ACOYW6_13025 [Parablastomonas sp. CN1-191]|uniref:hypothetical protein n=1 Tax=Parablastomonas sp. CN1-191 TaxID=3400908 RepID=UPI003BF91B38